MGSFHLKCGLTGLTIVPGDAAVVFFLRPEAFFKRGEDTIDQHFGKGTFVSNEGAEHFFKIDSLPIQCQYADYGGFRLSCDVDDADSDFLDMAFARYDAHKSLGILARNPAQICTRDHHIFVVRKDAYRFATSFKNHRDIRQPMAASFRAAKNWADYHVAKDAGLPVDDILRRSGFWRPSAAPSFSHAYDTLYTEEPEWMLRFQNQRWMLTAAMETAGRLFLNPIYGGQERTDDFVQQMFAACRTEPQAADE